MFDASTSTDVNYQGVPSPNVNMSNTDNDSAGYTIAVVDAVTNEAGEFTLSHFRDFFTDSFYLRSFWRSMVLGVAAVITTSVMEMSTKREVS